MNREIGWLRLFKSRLAVLNHVNIIHLVLAYSSSYSVSREVC